MNRLASPASRSSVIVDLLQYFKRLISEKDLSQGTDPTGIVSRTLKTACKFRYEDDLPDSIGFIAEMERWKMFCAGLQKQDYNQSLEEAIELADPNYYPNLHAMNRLASPASRSSVIVDLLQCFKHLIAEKDLSQSTDP
jgi:hypothetical protein